MSNCNFQPVDFLPATPSLPPIGLPGVPDMPVRGSLPLPGGGSAMPNAPALLPLTLATPSLPPLGLPELPAMPVRRPGLALPGAPMLAVSLATPALPPLSLPVPPLPPSIPCPLD